MGIMESVMLITVGAAIGSALAWFSIEKEPAKVSPTPAPPGFDSRPYVRRFQEMLIKRDSGALPKYGVDGKFGPETLRAAAKAIG